MKQLILPFFLAAAGCFAADPASLTGTWQLHTSIAGNDNDQSCKFTQKEADLSGTCSTTDQGNVTVTGKVDGKKVTFSYKSEYNGTPLTVQFDGTVGTGNKITGSVNVPEFAADGDFTATPSK